ncbi:hypothetical protein CRG98_012685 [Punica granatum]|uniref:Uncharacterized protein n=1 Tax=Punica granatum TaxID=22663 RepID=A0A2I0KEI2_PUNGR|nr:hypothetical protein CRG98_012685 [Punica granatum]
MVSWGRNVVYRSSSVDVDVRSLGLPHHPSSIICWSLAVGNCSSPWSWGYPLFFCPPLEREVSILSIMRLLSMWVWQWGYSSAPPIVCRSLIVGPLSSTWSWRFPSHHPSLACREVVSLLIVPGFSPGLARGKTKFPTWLE